MVTGNTALVGDLIIAARELIPDMPDTLPAPTASFSVVSATGSTLPTGTYYAQVTQLNPWGETLATTESGALTVGSNQGIQVTSQLLPSATKIRCYLTAAGGASGTENQFVDSTSSPFVISSPPTNPGYPPNRSTAWIPDDNGDFLSAATLYRWLNEGLHRASRIVGGIIDYTGVPSVQGQALYVLPGQWAQLTSIWYDGFPLNLSSREYFFRRNTIQASVLASAAVSVQDDRTIIEVFYQPVRTAGATTLSSALASTDINANVVSTANFLALAPPMAAQIGPDSNGNIEIVNYYTFTTTQLQGMIRGLSGTYARSWPAGTPVVECNIPIAGRRLFNYLFHPGDSQLIMNIPTGWRSVLPEYILYRARLAEQMDSEAQAHLKIFEDSIKEWGRANRQIAGPRSISIYPRGAEVVPGFG